MTSTTAKQAALNVVQAQARLDALLEQREKDEAVEDAIAEAIQRRKMAGEWPVDIKKIREQFERP